MKRRLEKKFCETGEDVCRWIGQPIGVPHEEERSTFGVSGNQLIVSLLRVTLGDVGEVGNQGPGTPVPGRPPILQTCR